MGKGNYIEHLPTASLVIALRSRRLKIAFMQRLKAGKGTRGEDVQQEGEDVK